MIDEEKEFTHESYGMVSFSHRSGNPKLFHSALEHHYNYVTLSVKTCRLIRSDTGDRLYGPTHGDIVEVDLSASQFAELLTTMNVSQGAACTIRRRGTKGMEPPPNIDSTTENMRSEFKARAVSFARGILGKAEVVGELLKKPTINKADRKTIGDVIWRVAQELEANMPFFVEMYQEATGKMVNAAKAEIEGFMVAAVRQAGLAALAAGKVNVVPPSLPTRSEPTCDEE